jgi:hypothetical protein
MHAKIANKGVDIKQDNQILVVENQNHFMTCFGTCYYASVSLTLKL